MSSKSKNFLLDIFVVIAGIGLSVGIFAFIQYNQQKQEKESLIPRAREAIDNKQFALAINLLEKAQTEFPSDNEVDRMLAEIYFVKRGYEESLKYYNELIKVNGLSDKDKKNLGEIYYESNEIEGAFNYWKDLTGLEPRQRFLLASIYYSKNDFVNYFENLNKLIQYQEPLALLQIRQPDLTVVGENFEKAKTLEKLSEEFLNLEGLISLALEARSAQINGKNDFSELIQIAIFANLKQCKLISERISALEARLISQEIPTYQTDFYKGKCKNQTNEPDSAIPLIQNAINADPTVIEYREELAESFYLKKDLENLKKTYSDILAIQNISTHHENLGVYLFKSEQIDGSLASYKQAFELEENVQKKREIAFVIYKINFQTKQSEEICYDQALLNALGNPENSEEVLIIGVCEIKTKNTFTVYSEDFVEEYDYLASLQQKNDERINEIVDQDTDGFISTNYFNVGRNLLD